MHVVIFEGIHWKTFAPLSLSRPVFMLATGMATLLEKQVRHTNPTRLTLWVRPELVDFCRERVIPKLKVPTQVNVPLDDEPALLVSGRTLHFRKFTLPDHEAAVIDEGDVVRAAWVKRPGLSPTDAMERSEKWMQLMTLPPMDSQTRMVTRLWDLITWNEESLIEDSAQLRREHLPKPKGAFHMLEEENIWIGQEATIQPGVVLDASKGPVVVDHQAVIGANSVLQGPCYLGPFVQVRPLSLIRSGTSVGTMCRIGGEVSNSIVFGYSNKAHDGFLGDSYVGKWVNIGAGTTTSNLKNTYGQISVMTRNGPEKTGRRHLGALIGDHVKTAIGTRLMAGSYVGFGSMLAGSGFAGKFIPSFAFWTDKGIEPYRINKAIEVMKTVFGRRDRTWTNIDETVVRYAAQMAPEVEAQSVGGGR
ncbi:MAG TPA: putative sugar nucleotidyl transferase [Tepidisphaeraceae bacterium]|nr:putative sugar nucleotidyl transferase [Tepidisphaeraceae bacterium]